MIDTSLWKEYKIKDLFNDYTGGDLILREVIPGDINIVSHKKYHNSVERQTEKIERRKLSRVQIEAFSTQPFKRMIFTSGQELKL